MTAGAIVNSIGLCFDIAGALLIFRFGLPAEIRRGGVMVLALEQADEVEAAKASRYDIWAAIGVSLLVTGFVLQLIGNVLQAIISADMI